MEWRGVKGDRWMLLREKREEGIRMEREKRGIREQNEGMERKGKEGEEKKKVE